MLLVPLPCPPDFEAGDGCVAAGTPPEKRKEDARTLYMNNYETLSNLDRTRGLAPPEIVSFALELGARMPTDPAAASIRSFALSSLRSSMGCSMLAESKAIEKELVEDAEPDRRETWLRATDDYCASNCEEVPSFAQCMPDTFIPGASPDCWSP